MKFKLFILILCSTFFLCSCWDQRLLKESKLVYSASYDLESDNELLVTSVIKTSTQKSTGPTQSETTNVIFQTKAKTLSDARMKFTRKISGDYATNKNRVLLLGNDLAKQDIYPIFDIIYRDPRSSLGAKVIISKGRADEILKLNKVEETLISEEILNLINTGESHTIVPIESVQTVCTTIFDPGEDVVLPLVEKNEDNSLNISGVALFDGHKYTGKNLLDSDPTMLLLLKNEMQKFARFTLEVNPKEKDIRERFVAIQVKKSKSKMNVKISKDNKITVNLNMKMKVDTLEYPKDELAEQKEINFLNKELSKLLTLKAEDVIQTLQKANCDAFAIGRELISYHPKVWKKLDWNKDYAKVTIKPKVEVEVIGTGIIK